MLALKILAILALLIALLLLCPAGVSARWGDGGFVLRAFYGPLRYRLLPERERKKRRGRPERGKKKSKGESEEAAKDADKPAGRGGFREIFALLRPSGRVLRTLCRHVVIKRLRIEASIAREDAHRTALAYAGVCAAVPLLLKILDELFVLKKPSVRVVPDFAGARSQSEGSVRVSLRPAFALSAGIRLLLLYIRRPKHGKPHANATPTRKKGGKQHEPTASHQ